MIAADAVDSRFRLSEPLASELAETYGTPLYVVDEAHFRARIQRYLAAIRRSWPNSEISFASKANSTVALIAIAYREGCQIDVASEGELRVALRAGVPAAKCHFHGNNKSRSELLFALSQGIGHVVIDHYGEIEMLSSMDRGETKFVIRLAPGVDPVTHAKISTGQADTKFGFNIADGSAEKAVQLATENGIEVYGYHCHVGSQLLDPEAQRTGGELIARFAVEMEQKHGLRMKYINVGGGLGVKYVDGDEPMAIEEYNALIADAVRQELGDLEPILGQEPGRSLIAESGVTLYRVGVVKTVPAKEIGTRTYVSVDGGLSDNPRPALYGSKYTVERVSPIGGDEMMAVTVSGKHCETDQLFESSLPADTAAGDLLQVLCTGAYNASMANNYNRYPRPATVLIRPDGTHTLIQRRDSWDEMLAREILPEDI